MEKKKVWMLLALCVVLFAGALVLAVFFADGPMQPGGSTGGVVISEVLPSNHTYPDREGRLLDYIELYNPTDSTIDLSNYKLSDDEVTIGYTFPQGTVLPAGGYTVIWCDPNGDKETFADFGISRDGETIYLYNSANVRIAQCQIPAMAANTPYVRQENGSYHAGTHGTPGFANTEDGYSQWLEWIGVKPMQVVISEVQSANRSAILNSSGQLCDWVELYNAGTEAAVLDGCYLSDDPQDPMKWRIESLTIAPGEYAVIPCAGQEGVTGEANFALSKNGCSLLLSGPVTNVITQLEVPALADDSAWQMQSDNTYVQTDLFSPGFANTELGYQQFRQTQGVRGALAIWEVMPSNDRYLVQNDGNYYDWIELKNISSEAIELSDYAISDSSGKPLLFQLPSGKLEPNEVAVIICAKDAQLTGKYIYAPFALDWQECWLYLTHIDQGYSDYIHIADVPYQASIGRMDGENGVFYFTQPTPGKENAGGLASIANSPFVQTPGGVYNGVESVSVVLTGEGQIRYTLDGSIPTENSRLYTDPLTFTETTTLRAACFVEGKVRSDVVTTGYIINENHTMPVLSLSVDPDAMFGYSGIYTKYTQDREIPCNLTLYEGSQGFSVDCGIKMHGHTGLMNPKKSFRVNFRGVYGADVLNYPVYGEDAPRIYDSLCIRAGQDYLFAIFREELFSSLCQDMTDTVLTQRSKYCILYINGEYWGIYNLKEAFTELYYAQNRGVSEESVEIIQAPTFPGNDVYSLMTFLSSHDMTVQENYEYACSVINEDSLIDWMIIEGYSTNGDVQQNLRYFRSSENGNRYEFALYDLDWAFYYHNPFIDILSNEREMNWQHLRITRNMIKNPTFRAKFLARLSYHLENTLSTENVLSRIDYFHDLLAPEVPREKQRWGGAYSYWENTYVARLRNFIAMHDHPGDIVRRLQKYIGLTRAEIDQYFWRWV